MKDVLDVFQLIKCKSIYKTGSSCILPNSNDIDIVCFFDDKEKMNDMKKYYSYILKNAKLCPHYDLAQKTRIKFLGSYIYHYLVKLVGDDIDFSQVDFLNHKKEWCEIAKKFIDSKYDLGKKWYHILIGCYIIDKNSYELSNEQIEKVQKVHDSCKITKTQKEYIDKIINSNL